MNRTQQNMPRALKQFYAYAWRLLKNELIDDARENQTKLKKEISMTDLTSELAAVNDRYFVECHKIYVQGICVELDDFELAMAIRSLEAKQQAIVTLYYVINLSERVIAEMLELHISSVQRARYKALKNLRAYLEGCNYGR